MFDLLLSHLISGSMDKAHTKSLSSNKKSTYPSIFYEPTNDSFWNPVTYQQFQNYIDSDTINKQQGFLLQRNDNSWKQAFFRLTTSKLLKLDVCNSEIDYESIHSCEINQCTIKKVNFTNYSTGEFKLGFRLKYRSTKLQFFTENAEDCSKW